MPIKAPSNFTNYIASVQERKINALIKALEYVGLQAVAEMRHNGGYTDRTGNLRSSTGFAVVYNGRVVRGNKFENTGTGTDGTTGTKEGSALIQELANTVASTQIALILVAGMDYAVYVEAMGKNVILSASKLATQSATDRLKKLGFTVTTQSQ